MWKGDMIELLFPPSQKKVKVEEGMSLKNRHIPDSLYKYRTFDDHGYSLKILENDQIKLSIPEEFNDPYDCALTLSAKKIGNEHMRQRLPNIIERLPKKNKFTEKEIEEIMKSDRVIFDFSKLYAEKYPPDPEISSDEYANIMANAVDAEFEELYKKLGSSSMTGVFITCFSESHESILMWSHYSNQHEGFCIEYNFKEVGYRHPLQRLIFPVIYTDNIIDVSEYLLHGSEGNLFMLTHSAINKSKVWEYEQEWRYVFQLGPSEEMQYVFTPPPKAVYLGARISVENKEKILQIAHKRKFKVYQMNMKPSEFALESKRIL